MDQEEIRNIVREMFRKCYEIKEYKLVELYTSEVGIEFSIVNKTEGCIATFKVGNYGIYKASSQENLLDEKYEIRKWLDFYLAIANEVQDYA